MVNLFNGLINQTVTPAAPMPMNSVLDNATTVLDWVLDGAASVLGFITANPVILVIFLFLVVGFVWGFLRRIWQGM